MCLALFAYTRPSPEKSDMRILSLSGCQPPSYSLARNDAQDDVSFLMEKAKRISAEPVNRRKRKRGPVD